MVVLETAGADLSDDLLAAPGLPGGAPLGTGLLRGGCPAEKLLEAAFIEIAQGFEPLSVQKRVGFPLESQLT